MILIDHCDWSVNSQKRWMCRAVLVEGQPWRVSPPEPVGEPGTLLERLRSAAGARAAVLVGFDFPIGVPQHYAQCCGIEDFLAWLPGLGHGAWAEFYAPAERPEQISLYRPFYPLRAGNARQAHLLEGLGVGSMNELRRLCELPRPGRRAAAPLFWTLGGQQVGKAAISGWRDVLAAALQGDVPVSIWPFSGALADLLQPGAAVLAETYPAEFYGHLGVKLKGSKRSQAARAACAPALLAWVAMAGLELESELRWQILDGFGPKPDGEDRFDALIGALGMINVSSGGRQAVEPQGRWVKQIEGWILGQEFLLPLNR